MTVSRIFMTALVSAPLMIGATLAQAQSGFSISDSTGKYSGNIDNEGRISDGNNKYIGNIDRNGTVSGPTGSYLGSVEGPSGGSDGFAGFSNSQIFAALRLLHNAH